MKNKILVALLLCLYPVGSVLAQTPTPTAIPVPDDLIATVPIFWGDWTVFALYVLGVLAIYALIRIGLGLLPSS